jgi:hypothetical protein
VPYRGQENTRSLEAWTDDVNRWFVYRPHGGNEQVPPPQSGQRVTWALSPRAARVIKGAAAKADALGVGMRAFWTFTLDADARAQLEAREFTIGGEVGRTLKLLAKYHERHGRPRMEDVWSAENPGAVNPHGHLLTNLLVKRREFQRFAALVESMWGHGTVHMERIRHPLAAGQYMLKAVGYASKGADQNQGPIVGNRYGVSKGIRPVVSRMALEVPERALEGFSRVTGAVPDGEVLALGERAYATPYGVSFGIGTDSRQVVGFLKSMEA